MAVIEGEVEFRDWDAAVVAMTKRIIATTPKATKLGMYLVERNVKFYLRTFTHRPGEPTNSPRGGPPALVTGNLLRSWRTTPVVPGRKPFTWETEGGPTAVYARIQELSGMAGRGRTVFIPKRPYTRPMLRASRRGVRRIYIEAWSDAIRG